MSRNFAQFVDDLPRADVSEYRKNKICVEFIVVQSLYSWFADCWYKAGGWYFPIPIVLVEGSHGDEPLRITKLSTGNYD